MNQVYVLCVDDDPEDLRQIEKDLAGIGESFPIEYAESAEAAQPIIAHRNEEGDVPGLIICAHVLSGENGVDFLIRVNSDLGFVDTRKMLITRNATFDDTIKGLNEGRLNYFLSKPWKSDELAQIVKEQLTEYFIRARKNPMPQIEALDSMRILDAIHKGLIPREV